MANVQDIDAAWAAGQRAAQDGRGLETNPYFTNTHQWHAWIAGWHHFHAWNGVAPD